MHAVRCCNKMIGELESGKARFKCKQCGTFITAKIVNGVLEEEKMQPPKRTVAPPRFTFNQRR